jgi:hypothetical protein
MAHAEDNDNVDTFPPPDRAVYISVNAIVVASHNVLYIIVAGAARIANDTAIGWPLCDLQSDDRTGRDALRD